MLALAVLAAAVASCVPVVVPSGGERTSAGGNPGSSIPGDVFTIDGEPIEEDPNAGDLGEFGAGLTGGCCFVSACLQRSADACQSLNGAYLGNGTDCGDCADSSSGLPPGPFEIPGETSEDDPVGPCCFRSGCQEVRLTACELANGVFLGAELSCVDCVTDAEELLLLGQVDTDGDGRSDLDEIRQGFDRHDPTDGPDIDGDGIPNGADPDVDGDGLENGEDDDVDGDGIPNDDDDDIDGDGLDNDEDDDDDGDGLLDIFDDDDDGDGVPDDEDDDEEDEEEDEDECDDDGDCTGDEICERNECVDAECNNTDNKCPTGKVCERGRCVNEPDDDDDDGSTDDDTEDDANSNGP